MSIKYFQNEREFQEFIYLIIDELPEKCPVPKAMNKSAALSETITSFAIGQKGEKIVKTMLEKKGHYALHPAEHRKRSLIDLFAFAGMEIWLISVKTSTNRNFPAIPDADESRFPCALEILEAKLKAEGYYPYPIHLLRYQIDAIGQTDGRWHFRVNNIIDLGGR